MACAFLWHRAAEIVVRQSGLLVCNVGWDGKEAERGMRSVGTSVEPGSQWKKFQLDDFVFGFAGSAENVVKSRKKYVL